MRSNFHLPFNRAFFEFVVPCPPKLVELGSIGRPTIINALKFVSVFREGRSNTKIAPTPSSSSRGKVAKCAATLGERLKATACEAGEGLRKPL